MRRSGAWRIGAVVLVSMVAGSLAIPRIAQAVGSIVTIQDGVSANRAGVDKAHHLLGAEAAAPSFHVYKSGFNTQSCQTVVSAPANQAVILKDVVLAVAASSGGGNDLVLYAGAGCPLGKEVLRVTGLPGTTTAIPLEPGFAVAAGTKISAGNGNISLDMELFGYLVPKADAPATTKVTST
jgi:hypothetical protein